MSTLISEPKKRSSFKGIDLISIKDMTRDDIEHVLKCANDIKDYPRPDLLRGYVLGNCFFEASTRTRLSFEAAMVRLGGAVIGFSDSQNLSIQKGESFKDTIKMMDNYVDVIALRHFQEGSCRYAAEILDIPVINAGDGAGEHPTQTLLDLFTIKESLKNIDKINIGIAGDLEHGRTAHSLALASVHFNWRIFRISPFQMDLPVKIQDTLNEKGIKHSFHKTLKEVLPELDILYMTRLQQERFKERIGMEFIQDKYELKKEDLKNAKKHLKILHPLPRVKEIHPDVDETPHAYYFRQAQNGLYVRQALLGLILGKL